MKTLILNACIFIALQANFPCFLSQSCEIFNVKVTYSFSSSLLATQQMKIQFPNMHAIEVTHKRFQNWLRNWKQINMKAVRLLDKPSSTSRRAINLASALSIHIICAFGSATQIQLIQILSYFLSSFGAKIMFGLSEHFIYFYEHFNNH